MASPKDEIIELDKEDIKDEVTVEDVEELRPGHRPTEETNRILTSNNIDDTLLCPWCVYSSNIAGNVNEHIKKVHKYNPNTDTKYPDGQTYRMFKKSNKIMEYLTFPDKTLNDRVATVNTIRNAYEKRKEALAKGRNTKKKN